MVILDWDSSPDCWVGSGRSPSLGGMVLSSVIANIPSRWIGQNHHGTADTRKGQKYDTHVSFEA